MVLNGGWLWVHLIRQTNSNDTTYYTSRLDFVRALAFTYTPPIAEDRMQRSRFAFCRHHHHYLLICRLLSLHLAEVRTFLSQLNTGFDSCHVNAELSSVSLQT
jgi:hypothetical protein